MKKTGAGLFGAGVLAIMAVVFVLDRADDPSDSVSNNSRVGFPAEVGDEPESAREPESPRYPLLATDEHFERTTLELGRRPDLFVGEWEPEDFLRAWWGDEWSTVKEWIEKHPGRTVIPKGRWRMDGEMLPEEAREYARAKLQSLVLGEGIENFSLNRQHRIDSMSATPIDRAPMDSEGMISLYRKDRTNVTIGEEARVAISAALAPYKELMREAYRAVVEEEERITAMQIADENFVLGPFISYVPDEYLSVSKGQYLLSDTTGVWQTWMLVDFNKSDYYLALKSEYEAASKQALDAYYVLVDGY